jgi:hypothetical protein
MEAIVTQLPASPDLSHLKKQAKHLLRDALAGELTALNRFVETLPMVRSMGLTALGFRDLKLHDAQSVVAREYGFLSWTELKGYVEWKQTDKGEQLKRWLDWAYQGNKRERRLAVHMLREEPALFRGDPWLACALGDATTIQATIAHDRDWVNEPGGPQGMPPLIAVTHSKLILEDSFEAGLLTCARLLLEHRANVDCTWINAEFPDSPLSALFGAAGHTHNVPMTKLLLNAGANPSRSIILSRVPIRPAHTFCSPPMLASLERTRLAACWTTTSSTYCSCCSNREAMPGSSHGFIPR